MTACEQCWELASLDVMLRGGSVVDHYHRRISEQTHHVAADSGLASGTPRMAGDTVSPATHPPGSSPASRPGMDRPAAAK